jgi:hypothetical protein
MRPMGIIELLELAQDVEQVPLVPDQGPAEQLAAAGLRSSLHDRSFSASGPGRPGNPSAGILPCQAHISSRTERTVHGRPRRLRRDRDLRGGAPAGPGAQHRLGPDQQPEPAEHIPREPVQQGARNARSARENRGRTLPSCRTTIWWCDAKISTSLSGRSPEEAAVTRTHSSHPDKPVETAQPIIMPQRTDLTAESNQLTRPPPNPNSSSHLDG